MAYKISGNLSENARILVLKESDWSLESNTEEVVDSYEITVTSGIKTILARKSDGESQGYGAVDPTYFNQAPTLYSIGDKEVDEQELLEFTVSGTDPDNDSLSYSASNLPSGATFTPATRTFSWTPGDEQSGVYTDVEFTVTDDGSPNMSDSESITITVNDVAAGGTVESSIASDSDDGYFWGQSEPLSAYITGRDDFMLGELHGYGPTYAFLKFDNIDVPQGSSITEAKLTGTTTNDQYHDLDDSVTVNIYGNDEDNASAPSDWGQYSSLNKTSANVTWNFPAETWPDNEERTSPDIKTIIQEVVNRPGWVSGNSVMIMIEGQQNWSYDAKEFASYSDAYNPFSISITYE